MNQETIHDETESATPDETLVSDADKATQQLGSALLYALRVEFPEVENADKVKANFLYTVAERARYRVNAWREQNGLMRLVFTRFVSAWFDGKNLVYDMKPA